MKDIEQVLKILSDNNITQSEYAKAIGAKSRQSVNNWRKLPGGIPKEFLLPTVKFIKKKTGKTLKIETLLEYLQHNNTANRADNSTTTKHKKVQA